MARPAHPKREECLELLRTKTATPQEISTVYGVPINTVYEWVSQEKIKKILDPTQPIKVIKDIPRIPETHQIRVENQLTLQQQLDTIPVGSPVEEARGAVASMFRALRAAPLTGSKKEIGFVLEVAVNAYRQLRDDVIEESRGPGRELTDIDLTKLTRKQMKAFAELEGIIAGEEEPIPANEPEPVVYDDEQPFEQLEAESDKPKPEPFTPGK